MLLLLSGNRSYSVIELAKKYETSERTIHRYISTFRSVGFIVEQENGQYRIATMDKDFRKLSDLLYFSEEEAWLLTKAIHAVSDNNVLKENLEKKLYSLYNFDRVADTIIVKKKNSENIHALMAAIKAGKQVILRGYRSANSNLERDRLVEPFDFTTNYIAVWAFDPEDRQNKQFKTARIESVEVLEKPFRFAPQHKKLPTDVFRISSDKQINVKLTLSLRAYSLLIEEYPMAEDLCTRLPDNLWQFSGEVCEFEGVGRFVLGLMDEITILAPRELKAFVEEKIKKKTV